MKSAYDVVDRLVDKATQHVNKFIEDNMSDETFQLKPTQQIFEVSLGDLQKLFAQQLGVPASRISFTAKTELVENDGGVDARMIFNGLTVVVKGE